MGHLGSQLKQQVETNTDKEKRPSLEEKKIEADLKALISNKNYTGELNMAQQKLIERVKNKTGGLCSSSSEGNSESSYSDNNERRQNRHSKKKTGSAAASTSKQRTPSKHRNKQKCLFDDKSMHKDYDSDSMSITSNDAIMDNFF